MSDPFEGRPVPRVAIISAGILIVLTIILAATSKQTGVGKTEVVYAEVVQQRDLFFRDNPNGSVDIIAAEDGEIIKTVYSGEGGFIRGVMRGLVRERKSHRIGPEIPFRIVKHADGRFSLIDPATAQQIDLQPFGAMNYNAFGSLLDDNADELQVNQNLSMQ